MRERCRKIEDELYDILREETLSESKVMEKITEFIDCQMTTEVQSRVNFAVVIPKKDNSGEPFPSNILDDYHRQIAEEFSGSTLFSDVKGCFATKTGEKLECEDNMLVVASAPKEEFWQKREWLEKFTKKMGVDLGQKSIYLSSEDVGVTLVPGKWRKSVPELTGFK